MDAAIDAIVQYVHEERQNADYFVVSAIALLLYDYVLTVYDEISLIWLTPWNHIKFLFFLVRYIPFASMYPFLAVQLLMDVPTETCHKMWSANTWLIYAGILSAEGVLMVRAWAVWYQNRYIGYGLAMLWVATAIIGGYFSAKFWRSLIVSPKPYEGFRGCFATAVSNRPSASYILLVLVETVVMVLMVISAYKSRRYSHTSGLTRVIHRDGILFYVCPLVTAIVNLVVMCALPGLEVRHVMAIPLQLSIHSIVTSRILINIRKAAHRQPIYPSIQDGFGGFEMYPHTTLDTMTVSTDVTDFH